MNVRFSAAPQTAGRGPFDAPPVLTHAREAPVSKRSRRFLVAVLLTALMGGCAVRHAPLPFDPANPLKRVAVLPLKNDTNDVDGPNVVRQKMVQALTNRSYVVKDLKETDQILRDQMGINLGGQLDLTTPQKLGETLGVEGVLYGTLMDFDEVTMGVYNARKVRGRFRLVNTATGQPLWERGLGVMTEQGTASGASGAFRLGARVAAARDKEAPWVLLSSTTTNQSMKDSLLMGLGAKLLTKAVGLHLDYESGELARSVTDNLPWGPGAGVAFIAPAAVAAVPVVPETKRPEPPSFGYMEWQGKKDFTAVVHSVTLNKGDNRSWAMEAPLWITGQKMKMDLDMAGMSQAVGAQGAEQSPLGRMTVISRGDKKTGYTLYPNVKKYIVRAETDERGERPKVEKTKVGSETIDGHPCDKFKVTVTYRNGMAEEGFIWNARDLGGMTIRSEMENKDVKVTTDLRNIVLKASPPPVFEIPAGYTQAKNVMELMVPAQPEQK
jgi:hypothetical protein